ncbi:MAG: cytochrome c oxidase assembly protein [Rhizobiales bacterium]|nr:cytochrome c oxidase assembly protein [Hyphomicrobiales bacterium]
MAAPTRNKNRRVAMIAGGGALAMLGLAYASVPLYALFCQATGFGGTPQRADAAPAETAQQTISIRFDANTAGSLDWIFNAGQTTMTVKAGEQNMAYYRAANTSNRQLTGSAVFNVTPVSAGIYFNKIECFCFTEQTLKPGESVDMPVVFFVDSAILEDPDTRSIKEITLSYTFYPVDKPKPVSQVKASIGGISN